jgi:hypothetical protein
VFGVWGAGAGVEDASSVDLLFASRGTIKAAQPTRFCSDSECHCFKLIARADSCVAIGAHAQHEPHGPRSFTVRKTFSVPQSNVLGSAPRQWSLRLIGRCWLASGGRGSSQRIGWLR